MTRSKKRVKKPAIPQSQRIKNSLEYAVELFLDLNESRKKIYGYCQEAGDSFPDDDVDTYYIKLRDFSDHLTKLVHLDNTQLHHPFVQWILTSPVRKKFLRKLHRGLEVGVKRGLENVKGVQGEGTQRLYNIMMVRNFINLDRNLVFQAPKLRPKPYIEIQKDLELRGLIKHMSRQAFHKMVLKLQSANLPSDPSYNTKALPPPPKEISEVWIKAQDLLKQAEINLKAIWEKRVEDSYQKAYKKAQAELARKTPPHKPTHFF